jgi:hypothetical protein
VVKTKVGLFKVDLTAIKADCVAMTSTLCNIDDFNNLDEWALGVMWVVDPAHNPGMDTYNTVFFPKTQWAVTNYWDVDHTPGEYNHLYSYTCDSSTVHEGIAL